MSNKHLQLKPHNFKHDPDAWWYEDIHGIDVVVQPSAVYRHIKITWRSLEAALRRKRKP